MPRSSLQRPSFCECGDHAFLAMKRGVTLVDQKDAPLLHGNGLWVNGGYAFSKRTGPLHRAVVRLPSENTDHKNHDKLDNRRRNLRPCTKQENQFNKKPNKAGRSAFKGVSWLSAQDVWVVRISLNRKKIWVGSFKNEEQAARAYDVAARQVFGEFAYLNFPKGE